MVLWLTVLAALAEEPDCISSTVLMAAHNCLPPAPGNPSTLSWPPQAMYTGSADIHTGKTHKIKIKIKKNVMFYFYL